MGTKDDYARAIIAEGQRRGITPRGIVIGIAVPLVETNLTMYANRADPESLNYPYEKIGSDSRSSGLYQQQPPWWGTAACRMDPTCSAGMFFEALAKLDYNNPAISPGWYAQEVQRSKFPDRYDKRMAEAQAIYDRLSLSPKSDQKGDSPVVDYGVTKTMHGYNPDSIGIGNSDGPRSKTLYAVVHTQEAPSTAVQLANFCNSNQVSYNAIVDDEDTIELVPFNEAPWAAVEANDIGFHLCFAGSFAGWSRDKWLSTDTADGLNEDLMLWRGARAVAAACQQFDIPRVFAGGGSWPLKPKGICGHRDFGARGGGHSDPGNGFPMDEFIRRVNTFFPSPGTPPVGGTLPKSLVDGSEHTAEEFTVFADYHSWRADKLATALAQKAGIPTDDESLKKVK